MNASSVTRPLAQPAVFTTNRAEGPVEGSKPDGDGDRDDAVHVASTVKTSNVSPATGSLGSQIDVTA